MIDKEALMKVYPTREDAYTRLIEKQHDWTPAYKCWFLCTRFSPAEADCLYSLYEEDPQVILRRITISPQETPMIHYDIPDYAGEGTRIERPFTARYFLPDYTEAQRIIGTVSAPVVLAKDNDWREGAILSDSLMRLKGWLRKQLPTPETPLPGVWEIELGAPRRKI